MSLDVLFEQILRSEQKAEDRRSEISRINKEICECEKEIKEMTEIISQTKQKLSSEESCFLYEEQVEAEVLTKQSESLVLQRDKLKKSNEEIKNILHEYTAKKESEFDQLIKEVDTFIETYRLSASDTKSFARHQLEELDRLRQEECAALNELEAVKKKEEVRNALIEDHACLVAEVSHLRTTIIELDLQLEEKRKEVEDKKAEAKTTPPAFTESEYCRLQAELQSLDSKAREAEVLRLRSELAQLQKK